MTTPDIFDEFMMAKFIEFVPVKLIIFPDLLSIIA